MELYCLISIARSLIALLSVVSVEQTWTVFKCDRLRIVVALVSKSSFAFECDNYLKHVVDAVRCKYVNY